MRVSDVFYLPFVDDNTRFVIRDSDFYVLASGHWFNDDVLGYHNHVVTAFTYELDVNKVYITVDMEV